MRTILHIPADLTEELNEKTGMPIKTEIITSALEEMLASIRRKSSAALQGRLPLIEKNWFFQLLRSIS